MERKLRVTETNRVYEQFYPATTWAQEASYDTLIVPLPGFKKEQLKVQVTSARNLRIKGERPLGNNKWSRFEMEIRIPSNYDTDEISAKFENYSLYIKHPKVIAPAEPEPVPEPKPQKPATTESQAESRRQEQATQRVPAKSPTMEEQKSSADDTSQKPRQELQALMKSNGQEQGSKEAAPMTNLDKQAGKNADQKPPEKEKEPSFRKEKSSASELEDAKTVSQENVDSKKEELAHEEGKDINGDHATKEERQYRGGVTASNGEAEMEKEATAAETSCGGEKSRVAEDFKQALGFLLREMKQSRKLMNLLVAVLFVLIAVIYARHVIRSNICKSDE